MENIRLVTRGFGLPPKFFNEVLGCKVASDLPARSAMTREDLLDQLEVREIQEDCNCW